MVQQIELTRAHCTIPLLSRLCPSRDLLFRAKHLFLLPWCTLLGDLAQRGPVHRAAASVAVAAVARSPL